MKIREIRQNCGRAIPSAHFMSEQKKSHGFRAHPANLKNLVKCDNIKL